MNKFITLVSAVIISAACKSNKQEKTTEDFKSKAAEVIAKLKAEFPADTDWEMLPGDSANSFIISTKDSLMLYANLAEDSVKMKYRVVYVLKPQLSETDSLAVRKLQDSVNNASFQLMDQLAAATDPKEKDSLKAVDKWLMERSPSMPAFSNGVYSIYNNEPDYHFNHEEKAESEMELLHEGIRNFFMTGKFTFEDLLKLKGQDDLQIKQINMKF